MTTQPGLDLAKLRAYLDATAPGVLDGDLAATVIEGGKSNLTYVLENGNQRSVLRRPPLGHVLPTAHDMAREYRVLTALGPSAVPVPETILHCADREVIGAPFYVMGHVDGAVYRNPADVAGLAPGRPVKIAHALIDTLADLHDVDPTAVGLEDFGRPEGFLQRQVSRWKKQLDASYTRPLAGAAELYEALAAAIPASGPPTLIHGDFRIDNVILDGDDRVAAVLDWEMATLGDPLTDLGVFLVYYSELAEIPGALVGVVAGPEAGFPTGDELLARYAARRGSDLSHLDWYVAFGLFKLAVIAEGIHARFTAGQTVGTGFDQIGDSVVPLLRRGLTKLA